MFAYYRSSCHSTAIQRILTGVLGDSLSNDVVIVKVVHGDKWLLLFLF